MAAGANLYYPAENQLINYAEDPNYINAQRQKGIDGVDQSFGMQQQDRQKQIGLLGATPTGDQAAAIDKSSALSKAKAEAGVGNAAAAGAAANQTGALRGFGVGG